MQYQEVVNDHQRELANALQQAGSAVLCTNLENLFDKLEAVKPKIEREVAANHLLVSAVREALLSERKRGVHMGSLFPVGRQIYSRAIKRIFG